MLGLAMAMFAMADLALRGIYLCTMDLHVHVYRLGGVTKHCENDVGQFPGV